MGAKVSVIVPIYKVEDFISRCANSLLRQTMTDLEYIFVNDATPDASVEKLLEVLQQYPERSAKVKIVHHEKNKGLPSARNTGLSIATGEYVFHCDADDYVDSIMLETLYNAAVNNNADIVYCDWYLSFNKTERYMRQPKYDSPCEAVKAMLGGAMKYNVWNKLVKKAVYENNKLLFPDGYGMGEDMTMIIAFINATRIKYVHKAFYHYVKTNTSAFTQSFSHKNLVDLQYNVSRVENEIHKHYGTSLEKELAFLKLETKFPLLIMGTNHEQYREWTALYPESNKYIWQNKYISFRSRMLEWLACKRQWWLVELYYLLVIRFVYGVLYK